MAVLVSESLRIYLRFVIRSFLMAILMLAMLVYLGLRKVHTQRSEFEMMWLHAMAWTDIDGDRTLVTKFSTHWPRGAA